jgi:lipopolysaccharide biosynthesis protein
MTGVQDQEQNLYIPLLNAEALVDKPVKLICFYLPQFHAIPENDEWWGKGFTEWVNVQPANPQFIGHYQPHVPDELGYYNLLDTSVQKRQIELAKLYGIEGFCFYFYWFGGKHLLDAPLEIFLNNTELDLPFCLCWANENWSRIWDGLDSEILIAQRHSPEDDLAFIAHVARFMRDPRYIRINGKPLLLVYRPSLLPSASETAIRWRQWCRDNGLGEIYLTYTQSFESVNPEQYGFDAATEFPPNNSSPPNITNDVVPVNDDFAANVHDWRVFTRRSEQYSSVGYKLFRGVCPSWDNTARRKNRGNIFINSSPCLYQHWLGNAIENTLRYQSNSDERLIFINAWNEWAEGAHLEPDQKYGYGFLEATRMALVNKSINHTCVNRGSNSPVAIVIHAFYLDLFFEIVELVCKIDYPVKLYVTTPGYLEEKIKGMLVASGLSFFVMAVENRGRDILPFIKMIPIVIESEHCFILKLHTKKSKHRDDGDFWREDVFSKLVSTKSIINSIEYMAKNQAVGIIAPAGHVLAMETYFGRNQANVEYLARRLGVCSSELAQINFVAGSMFFVRVSVLIPLINLALLDDDFEDEIGQVDGTLAHAIERVFSVSAFSLGKTIADTNQLNKSSLLQVSDSYPFADHS